MGSVTILTTIYSVFMLRKAENLILNFSFEKFCVISTNGLFIFNNSVFMYVKVLNVAKNFNM